MSVADKLTNDLKKALKEGEKDALSVIRMVKAAVKNKEIEKGEPLSDDEIYGVIQSQVRQSRESLEQFLTGERKDLAENEEKHISILQSYLPKQLTAVELKSIIGEAIKDTGAKGPGDMGRVMKEIIPKVKGRADNRMLSELVKEALSSG
jgi:uncharacterized protein YqeY